MKFRGLDANGDWLYGQGVGSYAQNQNAIALNIATRLRLVKGSCFFATNSGVDYANLMNNPGQLNNLITALQNCILQTEGVVKIINFDYTFNGPARNLSVGPVLVQTVYGQLFIAQITSILGSVAAANAAVTG
jgi:hypothetical protein